MIIFELICADRHRFEGWFASADEFESQKAHGQLSCPVCSGSGIEKLLTAKIGKTDADSARETALAPLPAQARKPRGLGELIDHVLLNTEDVGKDFPAEARRIHQMQAPWRSIRGLATGEEAKDLLEEGIAVMPLPVPPRGDWH